MKTVWVCIVQMHGAKPRDVCIVHCTDAWGRTKGRVHQERLLARAWTRCSKGPARGKSARRRHGVRTGPASMFVRCPQHTSAVPVTCKQGASTMSAPCQHHASTMPAPCQHHVSTTSARCQQGTNMVPVASDSHIGLVHVPICFVWFQIY